MTLSRRDFLLGTTAVAATVAVPVVMVAKTGQRFTYGWHDQSPRYDHAASLSERIVTLEELRDEPSVSVYADDFFIKAFNAIAT